MEQTLDILKREYPVPVESLDCCLMRVTWNYPGFEYTIIVEVSLANETRH
jgi:hypothetical protein